jgi:hypothetical protein
VTLTATPAAGWKFDSWSGDYSGTANPFMFDIERNMTFVAHFMADTQTQNLVNGPIVMAPAEPDFYGHNAYGIQFHVGDQHFPGRQGRGAHPGLGQLQRPGNRRELDSPVFIGPTDRWHAQCPGHHCQPVWHDLLSGLRRHFPLGTVGGSPGQR